MYSIRAVTNQRSADDAGSHCRNESAPAGRSQTAPARHVWLRRRDREPKPVPACSRNVRRWPAFQYECAGAVAIHVQALVKRYAPPTRGLQKLTLRRGTWVGPRWFVDDRGFRCEAFPGKESTLLAGHMANDSGFYLVRNPAWRGDSRVVTRQCTVTDEKACSNRYPCGGMSRRRLPECLGGRAAAVCAVGAPSASPGEARPPAKRRMRGAREQSSANSRRRAFIPGGSSKCETRPCFAAASRDAAAIKATLDRGIKELTGATDAVQAWRSFLEPGGVVGVKVVPNGFPLAETSAELTGCSE